MIEAEIELECDNCGNLFEEDELTGGLCEECIDELSEEDILEDD